MRSPDAYERLILDVIRGNQTLFMRRDEVEAAWAWIDPIPEAWERSREAPKAYTAGTWGPSAADRADRARRPHLARGRGMTSARRHPVRDAVRGCSSLAATLAATVAALRDALAARRRPAWSSPAARRRRRSWRGCRRRSSPGIGVVTLTDERWVVATISPATRRLLRRDAAAERGGGGALRAALYRA